MTTRIHTIPGKALHQVEAFGPLGVEVKELLRTKAQLATDLPRFTIYAHRVKLQEMLASVYDFANPHRLCRVEETPGR